MIPIVNVLNELCNYLSIQHACLKQHNLVTDEMDKCFGSLLNKMLKLESFEDYKNTIPKNVLDPEITEKESAAKGTFHDKEAMMKPFVGDASYTTKEEGVLIKNMVEEKPHIDSNWTNKQFDAVAEDVGRTLLEQCMVKLEDLESGRSISNQNPSIGENLYRCHVCSESFNAKEELTYHMLMHKFKNFQCPICNRTFKKKCALKTHEQSHFRERHCCHICSKIFASKTALNKHGIIHTSQKPFRCTICSKTFNDRSNLNRHKLIHTGIKPYKCLECEKTFRQKEHLKKHLQVHLTEIDVTGTATNVSTDK